MLKVFAIVFDNPIFLLIVIFLVTFSVRPIKNCVVPSALN